MKLTTILGIIIAIILCVLTMIVSFGIISGIVYGVCCILKITFTWKLAVIVWFAIGILFLPARIHRLLESQK